MNEYGYLLIIQLLTVIYLFFSFIYNIMKESQRKNNEDRLDMKIMYIQYGVFLVCVMLAFICFLYASWAYSTSAGTATPFWHIGYMVIYYFEGIILLPLMTILLVIQQLLYYRVIVEDYQEPLNYRP